MNLNLEKSLKLESFGKRLNFLNSKILNQRKFTDGNSAFQLNSKSSKVFGLKTFLAPKSS